MDWLKDPKFQALYEKLKQVRESKTVELRPTPMLKNEIVGFDGTLQPFKLRYYQVQGIFHLLSVNRMVLGDGTGLGKTISTLAALCYLWERKPQTKVMVVCPKSAIRQWASELDKFVDGAKAFVATGNPKAREKVYREWASYEGPSVLLLNYHSLVKDWDHGIEKVAPAPGAKKGTQPTLGRGLLDGLTNGAPDLSVVFDECFDYHTPVLLGDGSQELIGKIVCSKLPAEVLSWNWKDNRLEPKPVVRWLRNPLKPATGPQRKLVKVGFQYAGSCRVTMNHKVYRTDGTSVEVRHLKPGSETAYLNLRSPTEAQKQIILGSLLGDASVVHPSRVNWGVCFTHGSAQRPYLDFKRSMLKPLGVSEVDSTPSGYGGSTVHRFRLNSNPSLCSRYRTHEGGKKSPSLEWLNDIGGLGLAVWYADDGSIQEHICKDGRKTRRIILNTQSFTYSDHKVLCSWLLWKFGVSAQIKTSSKGHTLYLPDTEATKFLALMPGALPGVEYKFPGLKVLSVGEIEIEPKQELVTDKVVSISDWKRQPKKREHIDYVYDLEVAGNHNYFVAGGALVSNCTAFKNPSTKTHQTCKFLSERAKRVWGLTATLLKNRLEEGFGIYKVIRPQTFTSKTKFLDDYCQIEMKPARGGIRVPVIIGYKNLAQFRSVIDPFFYGRPKHAVSNELPALTTREVLCELSPAEDKKYAEALQGMMLLGDGNLKDYQETKDLTALIYCQQVCNSLALLKFDEGSEIDDGLSFDGKSAKESALIDLLTEEFDDEKVIVYTRFESLVGRLQKLLAKEGIKSVRITGAENDKARKKAQDTFQDMKSPVKVVIITDAASEAINLQAAQATIFFDTPWSWGTYVQLLGRMIRIGSPHPSVNAIHLMAERPGQKGKKRETIDHKVIAKLRAKKGVIDQIIGEAAQGALRFERGGSDIGELVRSIKETV